MVAEALMSPNLPTLRPEQVLDEIRAMLQGLGREELVFLGEDDTPRAVIDLPTLEQVMAPEDDLETMSLVHFNKTNVTARQHVLDVIREFNDSEANLLPVVDNEGFYVGSLERKNVFQYLSSWLPVGEPGSVVVVETSWDQYSLQEITSIVEGNGLKVTGLYLSRIPETERLHLTLKLNTGSAPSVVAAFERYGYAVIYSYFLDQGSSLRANYDHLMRFLNP